MSEVVKSMHGRVLSAATKEELHAAVEKALEYRGDVTITLQDGTKVAGYVFNRDADAAQPFMQVFLAEKDEKAKISYRDIVAIAFTGQDLAAENSWAAYIAKTRRAQISEDQKG